MIPADVCSAMGVADLDGLPENLKQMVRDANLEVVDHSLTLDYSYWPADHILKVPCTL